MPAKRKATKSYYHAAQWTDEEIKKLKKRKQPVVTYNRIGRKATKKVSDRVKNYGSIFDDGNRTIKKIEGAEMNVHLDDGVVLVVKMSVDQVIRRLGQFNSAGDPIYRCDVSHVMSARVPQRKTIKKK